MASIAQRRREAQSRLPDGPALDYRVDARLALWSIVGFWSFYLIIITARAAVMEFGDQLPMLGRRAVVTLVGVGLTWLMYRLLERFPTASLRRRVVLIFLAAAPAAYVFALINYGAFYLYDPLEAARQDLHEMLGKDHSTFKMVVEDAIRWYFLFTAWGTLYLSLGYAGGVREAERRAARYRAEAQDAQLRALRYQINPHFLFNTLNALSLLVMKNRNEEAERMIINLSNFFRTSLTADPTADVPLADEIEMQKLYLEIEKVRFPDRLRIDIDVPDDARMAMVPGMILQPLVENAIKYGVSRSCDPVTVTIRARREGDRLLRLVVEDDGAADGEDAASGTGVGIANVCERLSARFGAASDCKWGARPGGGFRVDLLMPLVSHGA